MSRFLITLDGSIALFESSNSRCLGAGSKRHRLKLINNYYKSPHWINLFLAFRLHKYQFLFGSMARIDFADFTC